MAMKFALIAGSAAMLALHGTNAAASLTYEYTCESYDLAPLNQTLFDPALSKSEMASDIYTGALSALTTGVADYGELPPQALSLILESALVIGNKEVSEKAINAYWRYLQANSKFMGEGSYAPQYTLIKDYLLRGDVSSLKRYMELPPPLHNNNPPGKSSWQVQNLGPYPFYAQHSVASAYLALEQEDWNSFQARLNSLERAASEMRELIERLPRRPNASSDDDRYETRQQLGKLEFQMGELILRAHSAGHSVSPQLALQHYEAALPHLTTKCQPNLHAFAELGAIEAKFALSFAEGALYRPPGFAGEKDKEGAVPTFVTPHLENVFDLSALIDERRFPVYRQMADERMQHIFASARKAKKTFEDWPHNVDPEWTTLYGQMFLAETRR